MQYASLVQPAFEALICVHDLGALRPGDAAVASICPGRQMTCKCPESRRRVNSP